MKRKRLALYYLNVWIGMVAGGYLIAHGLLGMLIVALMLIGMMIIILFVW